MRTDDRRPPTRRLHIDRLDLDLHGVSPQTAEAALRQLGPALAQALAGRTVGGTSTARIDAGRIGLDRAADAETLASRLARRIAERSSGD